MGICNESGSPDWHYAYKLTPTCHADDRHKAYCAVTSGRNDLLPSPALLQQGYQSRRSFEWQSQHTASLPACPGSLCCRGSKQRSWSSANESALQYIILAAVTACSAHHAACCQHAVPNVTQAAVHHQNEQREQCARAAQSPIVHFTTYLPACKPKLCRVRKGKATLTGSARTPAHSSHPLPTGR
jgi:hypothetical protein